MVKQQKNVFNRVLFHADLPSEPIPHAPLVELMNDQRVLIENHHGVSLYGKEEIRIKVKFGQILVFGENLEIACMSGRQIILVGKINGISLQRCM